MQLDCDEQQEEEEALWLLYQSPYIAEGQTGWYVMPEVGDPVAVYFPTQNEEEAYATGAPRLDNQITGTNQLNKPDHKIFRTPYGYERDGHFFIRAGYLNVAGATDFLSLANRVKREPLDISDEALDALDNGHVD
ncbi:phage baseplate assembly protein V [Paenibacillus sp. OK076]|uniref:phage baseplate assembly protein V n=1 Tax=Paenibacillus sp. OK076 TaxID=1884379 RepID=UPI000B872E62|nr:phage baseplate assembly protein V [Paenibacillus sp. OK076]